MCSRQKMRRKCSFALPCIPWSTPAQVPSDLIGGCNLILGSGLAEISDSTSSVEPIGQASRDPFAQYGSEDAASSNKLAVYGADKGSEGADAKLQAYGEANNADSKLATYGSSSSSNDNNSKLETYGSDDAGKSDDKLGTYSTPDASKDAKSKPSGGSSSVRTSLPVDKGDPKSAKSKFITEHVRDWNGDFQVRAVSLQQIGEHFIVHSFHI